MNGLVYGADGKLNGIYNPYRDVETIDIDTLKHLLCETKMWKRRVFLVVYKSGKVGIVGYNFGNHATILEALRKECVHVVDITNGYELRVNSLERFARDLDWILCLINKKSKLDGES